MPRRLLQALNNHCTGSTTTVANSSTANLAFLLPKDSKKSGDNPCTTCSERVAEGDGTTVEVDLVLANTEQLHVGERDNTEGLVDLECVDLVLLYTGVLQRFWYGESWCCGELGWIVCSITPTKNLSDWLQTELLQLGL